jgi:hypothetical protein
VPDDRTASGTFSSSASTCCSTISLPTGTNRSIPHGAAKRPLPCSAGGAPVPAGADLPRQCSTDPVAKFSQMADVPEDKVSPLADLQPAYSPLRQAPVRRCKLPDARPIHPKRLRRWLGAREGHSIAAVRCF